MKKVQLFALLLAIVMMFSLWIPAAAATNDNATDAPTDETLPDATEPHATVSESAETRGDLLEYSFSTDFTTQAEAAVLIEMSTGTVLFAKELDARRYPASLTKIMTAMLAIEKGNREDILTVSSSALENLSIYGSTAGLLVGEQLSLDEMLYCIMVSSANEGCNVIAEHISGTVDEFVALMNQKAQELGMTETHFVNTHGLHDDNHYTTVRDLSILLRWAWANEQFREYATCTVHVVPATNLSESRTLHTTNYLTSTLIEDKYYYGNASGIKTGFTTPAGGCLASTATSGGMELLSIVCGCDTTTDANGRSVDLRFTETVNLFEYGFDNFSFRQVLTDQSMLGQPTVLYAAGRENVVVRAAGNASAVLPNDCAEEDITIELTYDDEKLEAPLERGQRVGTVTAKYRGQILATADLATLTAVERSTAQAVQAQVKETGGNIFSGLMKYWFLTIPIFLLLLAVIVLLIVRAVNVRKAKKRAEMRRRHAARRRRDV